MNDAQEFDTWNELKKNIDAVPADPGYYAKEGEVMNLSLTCSYRLKKN